MLFNYYVWLVISTYACVYITYMFPILTAVSHITYTVLAGM